MRSLDVWDSSLTAWGEVGVWRLDVEGVGGWGG